MATNGQPTAVGIVSAAQGEVFAKGEDGQMRRLNVGDTVFEGDVIVTANGSTAEITAFTGSILNVAEQQTVAVNGEVIANVPDAMAGAVDPLSVAEAATVIQQDPAAAALDANLLLEEEAAAAGLDGGDAGGGDFVDLARIVETAGGAGYEFPTNPEGTPPTIDGEPGPAPTLTAATEVPTEAPTQVPTEAPTQVPTEAPTQVPTEAPTQVPTEAPTQVPTEAPTQVPTEAPTQVPTETPTQVPTEVPPTLEGAASQVEESSLDEGESQSPGTDAENDKDVTSGSIPFVPGSSGLDRLVINGQDVTDGGSVQGQYGVLEVTQNEDGSYAYTYSLTSNVDHLKPELNGGEDGSFADDTLPDNFVMQVVNNGVVRATSPLTITITDDGPVVDLSESSLDSLMQTDAGLAAGNGESQDDDTGEFDLAFKVSFGADGARVTQGEEPVADGMRYGLRFEEGADSGLKDTATGSAIQLYVNEETGVVEGRAGSVEGTVIFTVSIDESTGLVTLSQQGAIQHTKPDGEEGGTDELVSLASGVLSVVATATDGDLDEAENTFDLGGLVQFGDDVPLVDLSENKLDTLIQTDAGLAAGNGESQSDDTGEFNLAFKVSFGADGARISQGEEPVADGMRYGLRFVEGADSGLKDTATGSAIKLYVNEETGVAEGRAENGTVIFTVSIDESTGLVTLSQQGAIQHTKPDGEAGGTDELVSLASDVLSVVATATDGDLDEAENTFDLGGLVHFGDDVPLVDLSESSLDSLMQTDAGLAAGNGEPQDDDTGAFDLAFKVSFGADGARVTQGDEPIADGMRYGLRFEEGADSGLKDTATGSAIQLYVNEETGVVEGRAGSVEGAVIFTVNIDESTGEVTLSQQGAIQHTKPDGEAGGTDELVSLASDVLSVVATATDGDLDEAENTFDLGGLVQFGDDVPLVKQVDGVDVRLTANLEEESALKNGKKIGNDETDDGLSATTGQQTLTGAVNWGADKFGSVTGVAINETTTVSLQNGTANVYFDANGNVQQGSSKAAAQLTVSSDGSYTLKVLGALKHAAGEDENWLDLQTVKLVGVDGDGDQAKIELVARVQDDIPIIKVSDPAPIPGITVQLVGSDAGYNNTWGYFIKGADGNPTEGAVVWDNVKNQPVTSFELPPGVLPSQVGFFLIPNGDSLNKSLTSDTEVTFSKNASGHWVVNAADGALKGQGAPAFFSDTALNPGGKAHINTTAKGPITGNQNWEDIVGGGDQDFNDVMLNVSMPLLVDDSYLDINATSDLGATRFTVSYGADGPGNKTYSLSLKDNASGLQDTALFSNNQASDVLLKMVDGKVVGYVTVDGTQEDVFTLSVNAATGDVTLDQHRTIVHGTNDPNEIVALAKDAITLTATVSDGDGDIVEASIDLGKQLFFGDDGPTANNDFDTAEWTMGKAVAAGNVITGEGTVAGGADRHEGMQDGAKATVLEVRAGPEGDGNWTPGTKVDADGATVQGQYGALQMNADGSYSYTAQGAQGKLDLSQANKANMDAFKFGTAYTSEGGEKLVTTGDGAVTFNGNGLGVAGLTADTASAVSAQLGYSPEKGTEALSLDLGTSVIRAVVDVSNLYQNESSGTSTKPNDSETGRWEAFDSNGNKVGEGIIGGTLFNNGNNVHQGNAEIEVIGADGLPIAFQSIVFSAVDYLQGDKQNDSSDYFVKAVSYEEAMPTEDVKDNFSYQMQDGDGDTDSANLTITVAGRQVSGGLGIVHEDALMTGNVDSNPSDPTANTVGTLGMGAASYTLSAPLQTVTSAGETVKWTSADGGKTLNGTADGREVMTVTIDDAGKYAVKLTGQIDHSDNSAEFGANENLYLQLIANKTVDGKTEVQGFNVKIQDDAPVVVAEAQDMLLSNSKVSGTGDLGVRVGADVVGATVSIKTVSSDLVSVKYLDKDGAVASTTMTVGSKEVSYAKDADGTVKGIYTDDNGQVQTAFTVTGVVNSDGTTSYVTNFVSVIDKVQIDTKLTPTTITFGDQGDTVANGGNSNEVVYTDSTTGSKVVITAQQDEVIENQVAETNGNKFEVSADDPTFDQDGTTANNPVVNWSSGGNGNGGGGFGVANNFIGNQSEISNKSDTEPEAIAKGDGAGERLVMQFFDADGKPLVFEQASFVLDHLGTGETAVVSSVLNSEVKGTEEISGDSQGNNTPGGNANEHTTVELTEAGDTVYFEAKENVEYRVADSFSVTVTQQEAVYADQVWLDFEATIVDGDGDTVSEPVEFSVVIDNDTDLDASQAEDALLLDNEASARDGFVIVGSDDDETVTGSDGDDVISAGGGDDVVSGGEGSDTIVINLFDPPVGMTETDTLLDFNSDDGDKLVLADVLDIEVSTPLIDANSTDTSVSVTPDGAGTQEIVAPSSAEAANILTSMNDQLMVSNSSNP